MQVFFLPGIGNIIPPFLCCCFISMFPDSEHKNIRFSISAQNMGWLVRGVDLTCDVRFIIYLWDVKIFPLISRRVLNNLSSLDKYYHYTTPGFLTNQRQVSRAPQKVWLRNIYSLNFLMLHFTLIFCIID